MHISNPTRPMWPHSSAQSDSEGSSSGFFGFYFSRGRGGDWLGVGRASVTVSEKNRERRGQSKFVKMPTEKSPGLKILWIWTIGTAAILVTNVVRTRLRDMEQLVNAQQQQQTTLGDAIVVGSSPEPDDGITPEAKS